MIFEKGEAHYPVEITHKVNGFLISYEDIVFDDIQLEEITNLKSVLERVRKVAAELEVVPSEFIIEFKYDCAGAFCAVDKNHALLLSLPITITGKQIVIDDRGIDEDYLLYHELMHAKEVLDGRFPSGGQFGPEDYVEALVGRLNDFANEGKLEAMGKPHKSRELSIENVYDCIQEDGEFGAIPRDIACMITREVLAQWCDKLWGMELNETEAHRIIIEFLTRANLRGEVSRARDKSRHGA